jgi:hypothetical protein
MLRFAHASISLALALALAGFAWPNDASANQDVNGILRAGSESPVVVRGRAPRFAHRKATLEVEQSHRPWRVIKFVRLNRKGRFHATWRVPLGFEGGRLRLLVRPDRRRRIVIWTRSIRPRPSPANPESPVGPNPPPDMLRNYHLHILFWTPPGTALEEGVVSGMPEFERNIQASLAAGSRSNIFAIPGSYSGPNGPGDPRISSIDEAGRSDPVPVVASSSDPCASVSGPCATTSAVAAEIEGVANAENWSTGGDDLILLFTGSPLAVCGFEAACSLATEPCGYHSFTELERVYAVVIMSAAENSNCANGGTPDIEFARQLTDHEQNEAIVDPALQGIEIADPCQGNWASQSINGVSYVVPALLRNGICAFTDE